jgi:AraC-like DNA-binding protein
MDGFARDKDVVRLIVDTFRAMPELPSLAMRDYKPYMALIACSPEDFAFCYLSNDLVAVYETEYRTTELLFFCDLLRCMRGRSYLNCVTNRVCDYFFRARRDTLRHIDTPLREIDMQYAESRLKELEEAVFRWKVRIYKWRTFTADELAEMCGMSYSHFRNRFKEYYGCTAADWLRQERISRIKEDMSYRPELGIKEVAERNRFLSASNFSDFCNQQMLKNPGELKQAGYEEWCERRMKFWNDQL